MDLIGKIDPFGRCVTCGRRVECSGGCAACNGHFVWTQKPELIGHTDTTTGLLPVYEMRWVRAPAGVVTW